MQANIENWVQLPEDAEERAAFNRSVELLGGVPAAIAQTLKTWAAVNGGGSFAHQCHIMANEVMKLCAPVADDAQARIRECLGELDANGGSPRLVHAVKLYREIHGATLKEAVNAVRAIMSTMPRPPRRPRSFAVGVRVTWTSQAGGVSKAKTGEIVAVVPRGGSISRVKNALIDAGVQYARTLDSSGLSRDHESYVVRVGSKMYWPRVSGLLFAPEELS